MKLNTNNVCPETKHRDNTSKVINQDMQKSSGYNIKDSKHGTQNPTIRFKCKTKNSILKQIIEFLGVTFQVYNFDFLQGNASDS